MSGKKPVIAVTGSAFEKPFSWDWWSWQCVRLALRLAGGIPKRVIPGTPPFEYDGLLISGGADISPDLYGQKNTHSFRCEPERDRMELLLLAAAVKQKKPVLGICRGAQLINIGMGGDMYQDANKAFRYYTPARTLFEKLFKRKASYISGTRWLREIFNEEEKQYITSLHHQAINRLGEGLKRIADDHHGMTQAIELDGEPFVIGVQWHPEFQLGCAKQRAIFKAFVNACAH